MTTTPLLNNVANPDIALLKQEYPQLDEFWVDGRYEFGVLEASYRLADALLRKHFGLQIDLSRDHLCPRIANRLDYLLWLQRIVDRWCCDGEITGLDIGTGASCIYPLLGCSITDWAFYATDINDQSLELCRANIAQNYLAHRVTALRSHTTLFDLDLLEVEELDFTMCNPPFYDTAMEMENSKRAKALNPATAKLVAQDSELFTTGGEEALVMQMIQESLKLGVKIRWYTTLVGKKSTLERAVNALRQEGVTNYGIHEIVHGFGKTRRWTIAWSFGNYRIQDAVGRSNSHSIRHLNPPATQFVLKFGNPSRVLEVVSLLDSVEITSHEPITIECKGNVWSRSYRRKIARGEPVELSGHYQFEIEKDRIDWVQGADPKVFEAFCSMLDRQITSS